MEKNPTINSVSNESNRLFEWSLIVVVAFIIYFGVYEAITQQYLPSYSVVGISQQFGFLTDLKIEYAPSKGIWRILAWIGSGMMMTMMLYSVRKRVAAFRSLGSLKHWLSLHMALGIIGPTLIIFHTTFKLGGIIATSFWCMIVTMLFGIVGRYIYVHIPRSVRGAELKVEEIEQKVTRLDRELSLYLSSANVLRLFKVLECEGAATKHGCPLTTLYVMIKADIKNRVKVFRLKKILRTRFDLDTDVRKKVVIKLKQKSQLMGHKNLLVASHRLLHYWHVLHVPRKSVV